MAQKITVVDAFTDRPFSGNPAAVCILAEPAPEQWMRDVAREMNLAETAYAYPLGEEMGLRWFAPASEVDLCGHATLATAHVLWEDGHIPSERVARFHTRSGLLTATKKHAGIELDFPVKRAERTQAPEGLLTALNVSARWVGRNQFDYLVEVDSEATVRAARPDLTALAKVEARGVMITSRADQAGEYDFVSRFFAPAQGIPEDPVTGSAHCALTPYWSERLGKTEMVAYQASSRGGMLQLRLAGDRVLLGGSAVTMLKGTLLR